MGYGHAENIASGGHQHGEQQAPPADRPPDPAKADPLDTLAPDWYDSPALAPVLAGHQVGALYRWLRNAGVPQRQIAALTGTTQPQVADILAGRRVQVYEVLVRIAEGLGIPRERMGLSFWGPDGTWYGPDGIYSGGATVVNPGEAAEMLRRQFEHLLALGAAAAFGVPVPGVGELAADLPVPGLPGDVPSRVGMVDVGVLRGYRENLRTLARTHGGQAGVAVALADWADRWLTADTSDTVRRALLTELAGLHTSTAWCCHDGGAPARSLYHFGRAVELATSAGDAYQAAYALRHAAMMLIDRKQPNDALKAVQLGSVRLLDAPREDPRVQVLGAECEGMSAFALSRLDDAPPIRTRARDHLVRARDGWEPPDNHTAANMHLISAVTWLHCGQLDAAEAAVTLASRTYGAYRRGAVHADLTRARLHVMSGDPGALRLAESAITATTQTRSKVTREVWLPPLAEALEARGGSDYAELARSARQIAATQV